MSSYKIKSVPNVEQTINDMSFKGGIPNIPERFSLPNCTQCGAEMTFFFQIAFPQKHIWEGKAMAFFHCTTYRDTDNYCPKTYYTRGQDDYPSIPDGFLDDYQANFRIYVFDTVEPATQRSEAKRILKFEQIRFEKINPKSKYSNTTKVGGVPAWDANTLDGANEIYKEISYMGAGFDFLMQVERDWSFARLPDAPLQMILPNYFANETADYSIFNGPKMYFLGTKSSNLKPPRVLLYLL
jgi:hypothetical protein